MRTTNDEGFKYSQLEIWLFLYHLAEENEIEHLQLCLLFLDNNLSKNDSKKVFGPIKPDKNSGFLYP